MDVARTGEKGIEAGYRAFLGVVIAILCLLANPVSADRWYVHYENAERASSDERWALAVDELLQALERKGDSGSRVRSYGMRVVDYFPYLELGIAYYHLGQPSAAKEAFDTEERLGAIEESPEALSRMGRYRELLAESERAADQEARDRVATIVDQSLEEARQLASSGRVDEAMTALATGLAAAPENAEAIALMEDLRGRAMAAEQGRRRDEEARRNLRQAKDLLGRGDAEGAAGLLRQILALGANAEAGALLAQAQEALAVAVGQESHQGEIDSALREARRLADVGRRQEALAKLERVFALEPSHGPALALRRSLMSDQRQAERDDLLSQTLEAGEEHFLEGRHEEALSAANRVLALDRTSREALDLIRRSYGEISRRLTDASALGSLPPGSLPPRNLPPAIRFVDQRQEIDGVLVELVERRDFRLDGVILDRSTVQVFLTDQHGQPLAASVDSQTVGDTVITELTLRWELDPGDSQVQVQAVDAAGASSRAEYRVRYERPWLRTPIVWLLTVLALVSSAGWGLWRRQQRRRNLRRRRFNPYVAGRPIFDPELFYGREALVQRILQTVHNNSLLLHGERRIGKTSLLHQVHRRLENLDDPDFEFYPVYIDIQGTPEEKFFATLADQIFESLAGLAREGNTVGAQIQETQIQETQTQETRIPALDRRSYGHHELIRELHGLLEKLRRRLRSRGSTKSFKVVLLIDEVDELNHYDPRVNQSLRSLFMRRFAENLAAVVAGVGIRKEWEKEGSPWYNFFEELEVKPIALADAQRLIVEPVRDVLRFEAGAIERIVEASAGKPFLIQRRCLALVGRLHEVGRRTVTLADVEALEAESDFASAREEEGP